MNKTQGGIKMLKAIRDQLARGDSLETLQFCDGISCSECPIYGLCAADKSKEERYEYLERQYSKYYIPDVFVEGEEVEVSDDDVEFSVATYLFKDKDNRTWVKVGPHTAKAFINCRKKISTRKVTLAEIEEKFGCKVEIVNE